VPFFERRLKPTRILKVILLRDRQRMRFFRREDSTERCSKVPYRSGVRFVGPLGKDFEEATSDHCVTRLPDRSQVGVTRINDCKPRVIRGDKNALARERLKNQAEVRGG
jgi:hypothetical protein